MNITESFSLNVKDYCEYCPDFLACSESLDITTLEDLPKRKAIHVIKCLNADQCEQIRESVKREMEAQREKSEKVQSDVRGCENKGSENGADSDNGQSDGGKTRISDIRQEENQCAIVKSDKGGWQEKLMRRFLRGH